MFILHDNARPEGVAQAVGAMFNADVFIEVGHGPTLVDNNLLMSPVSISIPSEGIACVHFGHLPVWIDGNAYFNGATVFKKENHKLVNKKTKATAELVTKDGKIYLKTNIGKDLKAFRDGIITTDTLGLAFEPEQPFENPDGTPITFNTDLLGNHRDSETVPGPLASLDKSEILIWSGC